MTGAGAAPSPPAGSPVAVALDLGGTHLKGGLVGPGGATAHLERRDTRAELGYHGVLEHLAAFVAELAGRAADRGWTVAGVGVGAPGPLNRATGVVEFAPNLGWRDAPLGADLARRTGVARVRLENDANAAAFAEAWVGAASGSRCLLGVTLGTGIGAGVVIGGRLFSGARGLAAELGHVVVDPAGPTCRCGRRGCVEAYFSGWGLVERYRQAARGREPAALRLPELAPEDVLEAWSRGEPHAVRVVDEGLAGFARGLAAAINVLNPDHVVFFGGLARSWDIFGGALLTRLQPLALPETLAGVCFEPSRLEWAGVLGAGGLVLDRIPEL